MINQNILEIAMKQSAIDSNCSIEDFKITRNKVVISKKNQGARHYLELPFEADLTSYGNNVVASVSNELYQIVSDYISKSEVYECFETPRLHLLMERLKPYNMNVCFMAEYFLPDIDVIKPIECKYEIRILESEDFKDLYLPQWSNALCEKRKHLDKIAVGAYDNGELIGLAGCSEDCETMWQIGIDVLPKYRRQGVASALTSTIALECLARDIVPFYCCAWSNIKSARNAIKSGFRPAWVQLTVKPNETINFINKRMNI